MTGSEQEPNEVSNSDSLDLDTEVDSSDETAQSDTAKEPKNSEPKRAKVGLLWLFVLATLAASAALGYFVNQLWQKTDQATASRTSLVEDSQAEVGTIRDDIGGLEGDLGALQTAMSSQGEQSQVLAEQTASEIALLQKSVEKQARHIKEIGSSNRDDWLLAEVEYLLRLANQRILMSKDSDGALVMLDSADRILHGIDDVSLHPVRKAIADDMAQLRAVEQADVDGAYLQLSAVAEQVEELRLYDIPDFGLPEVDTEAVTGDSEKSASERAGDAVKAIGAAFQKAFVIRQDQEKVEAMLPPQDELYLRQNLRLMLEQSQMAMLSRRSTIYTGSLEKAQRWIAQYFQIEDSATQSALETLSDLATLNVDPPLPDIAGSYRALKNYRQGEMNARPGLDYQPAVPDAEVVAEEVVAEEVEAETEVETQTQTEAVEAEAGVSAPSTPMTAEPDAATSEPEAVIEPEEEPVVEQPAAVIEPAATTTAPAAEIPVATSYPVEPSESQTEPSVAVQQAETETVKEVVVEAVEEPIEAATESATSIEPATSITDELDAISIPDVSPGNFSTEDTAPGYELIKPQGSSATTQGADA